jgi:hypothetical protein
LVGERDGRADHGFPVAAAGGIEPTERDQIIERWPGNLEFDQHGGALCGARGNGACEGARRRRSGRRNALAFVSMS